ncbi:MAG: CPBP family intramembrane metalloprotease [bacterium]|nr:CPBP family intramembrane metalloprotease [bacterium]
MNNSENIRPMSMIKSAVYFGIPTIALYLFTEFGIPHTNTLPGFTPVTSWFLNGGIVFIGMFAAAVILIYKDRKDLSLDKMLSELRLKSLNKGDMKSIILMIILIGILSGIIVGIWFFLKSRFSYIPELNTNPPFVSMSDLDTYNKLFLLVWIPFFFFNIIGEEIFWRGYILPRQELKFGRNAWLVNGTLWIFFHLPFGLHLIIMMIPMLFILPYIVQKRGNTWIGIIIHGLINGSAFLCKSFGLL